MDMKIKNEMIFNWYFVKVKYLVFEIHIILEWKRLEFLPKQNAEMWKRNSPCSKHIFFTFQ